MDRRIEAYVDTSALIAFLDRSDSYHALFRRLFSSPPNLIMCSLVLAEGHAWFLKKFDQRKAAEFLAVVESFDESMAIEAFDADAIDHAAGIIRRFSDQKLSLADAHGLALMEEPDINVCWSTDWHMGLSGA